MMRFEKTTTFAVVDFLPGREDEASEGLKAFIEVLNKNIASRGFIDLWTRDYLGGVHYGLDQEVWATITDEEKDLLFEIVPRWQIDTRQKGWEAMAALGVIRATVEFSGGNDEGYCENIVLFYGNGTSEMVSEYPKHEDERKADLVDLLTIPVYDRYGGFAGDFSVHGELTWDYAIKDVRMSGQESSWEGFAEAV